MPAFESNSNVSLQVKTMTTKYCARCIDFRANCFQWGQEGSLLMPVDIQFRKFFERSETNFIKDLKENLPRNLLLEVVN